MSIEMIHQNTESLKELSNKYKYLLERKEALDNEIKFIIDKDLLKVKRGEFENIARQIEKLKVLILTFLIQIQKLIEEIQAKDANRLY